MFAFRPRIEIAVRILLIAIVLFNGFAPTVGTAKSLTDQNKSVDILETASQDQAIEIPRSWTNFARPIPRLGDRQNNTASTRFSQPAFSQSTAEVLPLTFIENVGQFDENELFQAQVNQGFIHMAKDAIWISAIDKSKAELVKDTSSQNDSAEKEKKVEGVHLRLSFVGSDSAQLIGFNPLDTTVSFFLDNDPANWYPDVPVWGGVRYQDIYPGLDLEITSKSGTWLWQIVENENYSLSQSADKSIKIKVAGSDRVTKEGNLFRLHANGKDVSLPVPEIIFDGRKKHKTPAAFIDGSDIVIPLSTETSLDEQGQFTSYSSSSLDQSSSPSISSSDVINNGLISSTVLNQGTAWDIAADTSGFTYITGHTLSINFPTTPGAFQTTIGGGEDAIVSKLNASLSSLVYSTYVGGSNDDESRGIAIGSDGTAYITGRTFSQNFPATSGSFDTTLSGGGDGFVFKLNNDGTQLAYSTFFGGSTSGEQGLGVAVDAAGSAYIAGQTTSSDFPTTPNAYDRTFNGGLYDGYVLKLSPAGNGLSYSTYLGGAGDDCEIGGNQRECTIVVNSSGEAYIAGTTTSSGFPKTSGAYDQTFNGGVDGFVTKINAAGSGLVYSTFLGGSATDCDWSCTIAIDGAGNAYISGTTNSTNFPIAGSAFDRSANGGRDLFVSKLNTSGSSLAYSTYLGGSGGDDGASLTVNAEGQASVFGYTQSTNFPVTVSAYQGGLSGGNCGFTCRDAVLVTLASDGSKPIYSTYLGGTGDELGLGIAQGQGNSVFVTGWTSAGNFPTTPGAYDTTPSGGDVFVSNLQIVFGPLSNALTNSSNPGDGNFSCASDCSQATEGGPINTRTGGYDYFYTDISVQTDAGTLTFERTYSSLTTGIYSAKLGYGWTHNHDMYLVIGSYDTNSRRQITLKGHTANQYSFTQQSGATVTSAEFGVYAKLVQGASSFILTDKAQNRYEFNLTSGQLISYKNEKGRTLLYTYDTKGRLKKISDQSGLRFLSLAYSGNNTKIASVTDHTGRIVNYHYNASGDLDYVTDLLGQTWTYEYQNHLLTRAAAPGNITIERTEYVQGKAVRQYDGNGDLVVELTYNTDGTTTVIDALSNSKIQTYDQRGTLREAKDFYNAKQQRHYDANFRPDMVTDALLNQTYLTWSEDGANLTKIKDALQNETDITYGAYNNPLSIIDASNYETKYFYNDSNFPQLPTRIEYPLSFDGGVTYIGTDYEYYPPSSGAYAGKVKFVTDALGNKTYYTYTTIGQTASITAAYGTTNAITTTYVYDNLGRLVDETTAGITTHNVYNAAGRLTKSTYNYNIAYAQNYQNIYNLVTEYRYDIRGNQIAIIDTYGVITRTYYDLANQPVTVVQNLVGQVIETASPPARGSGAVDENIRTDTIYADNGSVIATIDPDNVITRTYYDQANRPVTVVQNLIGDIYSTMPPTYNPANPDQNIRTDTAYDDNGNVIAVIDTNGIITRTYYNELNRPVTVVQNLIGDIYSTTPPSRGTGSPDQNVRTDTIYDANGNVIATIDPANVVTRTYYDAMNRPETVVQNLVGDIYSTTPPNRTTGATSSNIRTDTWYDKTGNVIATIDPKGIVTRTYYDTANRPVTVVQNLIGDIYSTTPPSRGTGGPDQNVRVDTVYDQNGRKSSTIDPFGRETKYEYNELSQLKKVTANYVTGQPQNYQDKFNVVTEYSYDALGRRITTTDTLGRVSRSTYDDLSRVLTNTVNYLSGQGQNYKDPSGNRYNIITSYTYDIRGNQIAVIDTADVVTRTYFDRLGRPTTVVRNLGQAITNPTPPARGNPLDPINIRTDTVYLGDGNIDRIVDEMGQTTSFDYDGLGRQTLLQDPLLNPTVSQYNALGQLVLAMDANLIQTKYEYDALGRLSAVIENYKPGITPNHETNVRTEYTYDANGNRLTILDGKSHSTVFTYDDLNRLKTEKDALDHLTTYGYDVMGNRVSLLDANQTSTAFQYDELNRLYRIDYPSPDADVTFVYDVVGRRTSMNDGLGQTSWNYDNLDRPTSIIDPFSKTVSYDYDDAGNRSLLSYSGVAVNYQYDPLNRLTHVTGGVGGTVDYGYDAAGRLKGVTRPNGVNTSYQYYENGWLQNLTHASTTTTFASYQYIYDAVGNRKRAIENILWPGVAIPTSTPSPTSTSTNTETPTETLTPTFTASPTITDTPVPPATNTETLTPTASDIPVVTDTPSPTETPSPTLAPSDTPTTTDTPMTGGFNQGNAFLLSFLLEETPTPTSTPTLPPVQTSSTIDYLYDPLNRLTEANYSNGDYYHYTYDEVGNRVTQTSSVLDLPSTVNYVYDDANRLETVNGVTYTWDNNGNLLNDGANAYTYDSANRLKTLTSASVNATYAYNGLSDRLQETLNGQTTTFTMDLNAGLPQALSDGTNTYIYGNGRIAQTQSGTIEYLLGDALGSVRQMANTSVQITYARAYDPYGVVTATSGSSQTSYAYTGEYYGDYNELVYLRARYYAPDMGRFLSRDTWAGDYNSPVSLNRWTYVEGNPVNFTDPTGHIAEGDEARKADEILKDLQVMYGLGFEKDWGYQVVQVTPTPSLLSTPTGATVGCNVWDPGKWDYVELRTIKAALKDLSKKMGGPAKFRKFIGEATIKKAIRSQCGAGTEFRGCTEMWWSRYVVFSDGGTPPTNVDIKNRASIDKWTVVHEFAHAWDRNYGWTLGNGLGGYTGERPKNCDTNNRLPGCNAAGYYYSGIPPAGSGNGFNQLEDFAESVTAFVYPSTAEAKVAVYKNDPILRQYLYYQDYSQTTRWKHINALINLGVLK